MVIVKTKKVYLKSRLTIKRSLELNGYIWLFAAQLLVLPQNGVLSHHSKSGVDMSWYC